MVKPRSKTALVFRAGALEVDSSFAVLVVPDDASFSIQRQLGTRDLEAELDRFTVLQWGWRDSPPFRFDLGSWFCKAFLCPRFAVS